MWCCDLNKKKKSKQYSTTFATFIRPRPSEPTTTSIPYCLRLSILHAAEFQLNRKERRETKKNNLALPCYFLTFSLFDWKSSFYPLVFVSWTENEQEIIMFLWYTYTFADFSVNCIVNRATWPKIDGKRERNCWIDVVDAREI